MGGFLRSILRRRPQPAPAPVPAPALPSILLNAVPKSAGSYINHLLLRSLSYQEIDIAIGLFPGDIVNYAQLDAFADGNKVAHHHLEASDINRRYLAMRGLKAVIHTRDPRACLLSWAHHLAPAGHPDNLPSLPLSAPPPEYFALPFAGQIDWLIDHHLDLFVDWHAGWVAAQFELQGRLLFTRFEDFVADRRSVLRAIVDFHGIPRDAVTLADLPPDATLNFRVGRVDEWREAFTPAQQARCRARLPDALMRRFGWPD